MKIIYVAKHGSGGNDDEGAILYALDQLGHEVVCLTEDRGYLAMNMKADLLLFHKWGPEPNHKRDKTLVRVRMPKVFWYFDLVDFDDPTIKGRCQNRVHWMETVMPRVDLGFCTDGDWVRRHPDKLVWLTQGADLRVVGPGQSQEDNPPPILLTGVRNGGIKRSSFVDQLKIRYGEAFRHVSHGTHGRTLADLIASSKVCVAPDGPVTDHYWSNRVYLTLGFGGFLLHPHCADLTQHYDDGRDLVFYRSREELYQKVEYYCTHDEERRQIARQGHERTVREHTYLDRCQKLIQIVQERLF